MQYNQHLEQAKVYEAGKPIDFVVRELGIAADEVIKLASNENPNGCSPLVSSCISDMIAKQMPLYPDDHFYELKQALSNHFNITPDHFIIGCGSDQVISFCVHSKSSLQQKRSKMLISGFTFPMYQIAAQIAGIETIKTPSKNTSNG